MIAYQLDPSLHQSQPVPAQLDDGFSPPAPSAQPQAQQAQQAEPRQAQPVDPALWAKSDF